MASAAQIEANRQNSQLSTGPSSPGGKVSSSGNSRTHGLAAGSILSESTHPSFKTRLSQWARDYRVATPEAQFALETAVAMTFRLDACASAFQAAVDEHAERADYAWDTDRKAEAAAQGKLARQPEVIAPRLETTAQGIEALIRIWNRLGEALVTKKGAWNELEVATACDLLGIPAGLRDGRLPFNPMDPTTDPCERRHEFIFREYDRLKTLSEALTSLDKADRIRAVKGHSAIRSKPVMLVLRYEREATRRFNAALRTIKASEQAASEAALAAIEAEFGDSAEATLEEPILPPMAVNLGSMDDGSDGDRGRREEIMAEDTASLERLMARLSVVRDQRADLQSSLPAEPEPSVAILEETVPSSLFPPLPVGLPAARPNRHRRRAKAAMARAGS